MSNIKSYCNLQSYTKELCELINNKFKINSKLEYEIFEVDAKELLDISRLDTILKIKYIEFKDKNIESKFINYLYEININILKKINEFNLIFEPQKSVLEYMNEFDELINYYNLLKAQQEIIIPVDRNMRLLDEGHKLSYAIYYSKKVKVIKFKNISIQSKERIIKEELKKANLIDYVISEYCKYSKYIKISFCEKKLIKKEDLGNIDEIIYYKYIKLNKIAIKNIDKLYKNYLPIKNNNDLLEQEFILVIKSSKNIECQINQLDFIQFMLNKNSINLINSNFVYKDKKLINRLNKLKSSIITSKLDLDRILIDSTAVLGLYNIRGVGDLDFITNQVGCEKIQNNLVENNEKYLKYHEKTKDELLYNPNNYLIFNGLKFITLENLKIMKNKKATKKDLEDVKLIDLFLIRKNNKLDYLKYKNKIKIRRFFRYAVYYFKLPLKILLVKLQLIKK